MKNILITLCARGGSKGIPKKNIKLLNGKPLITYTIEIAKKFHLKGFYTFIALSTDDFEIKKVALKYGLNTDYIRPSFLATDDVGKVEVIKDLLSETEKSKKINFDYILDLDISSPLRTVDDLINSFKDFKKNENALNMFSVSKASKNPYFNMVEQREDGYYSLSKETDKKIMSRQKTPIVYELNASFYWYRRLFFKRNEKSVITLRSMIYEMNHECFDIDNINDLNYMEFLISAKKVDYL